MYFVFYFFFFNDTATTEIYTLSLHDALPICTWPPRQCTAMATASTTRSVLRWLAIDQPITMRLNTSVDRKSTRLNSSHANISYAVFCLKKKKKKKIIRDKHDKSYIQRSAIIH